MKIKFTLLIIILLAVFSFQSCLYDKSITGPYNFCDTTYYYTTIKPIVDLKCATAGCHDGNSGNPGNYLIYADLKDRIASGIVKTRIDLPLNDPEHMPQSQNPQLTADEYNLITEWINTGYPGCDLTGK